MYAKNSQFTFCLSILGNITHTHIQTERQHLIMIMMMITNNIISINIFHFMFYSLRQLYIFLIGHSIMFFSFIDTEQHERIINHIFSADQNWLNDLIVVQREQKIKKNVNWRVQFNIKLIKVCVLSFWWIFLFLPF